MGQIAVLNSPKLPPSNMQKVITALAVVAVGHIGILWALAHMQPMQLRDIETTKPIQVRFVKIVEPEPKKPEPPKPKEPPKPPKEVKIVEKKPLPKPLPKVHQVKTPVAEPQFELPQPEPTETKPTPSPQPEPQPQPRAEPKANNAPVRVDANSVSWIRPPKPKLVEKDFKCISNDSLSIRLDVDEKGRIKAQLAQSSGCKRVDDQFVSAVRNARIEVLRVNGIATSFYTTQIFSLKLKNSEN